MIFGTLSSSTASTGMCLVPEVRSSVLHPINWLAQQVISKKISSVGAIVYLVTMISHSGVNLLTYFFLLISPQTLDFIN